MAGYKRFLPYAAVVLAVGCRDQGLPSESATGPVESPSLAIGFGSASTFNNGQGSNSSFLTMTAPAVSAGDVLVAQVGLTKDILPSDKICAPAGWTLVVTNHFQNKYVQAIYYHAAPANAGALQHTWRFKTSAGNCAVAGNANARTGKGATGGMLRFTGVDPQQPIDAFASLSGGSSGPRRAPSVITSADGAQVLRFFTAEKNGVVLGPATTRLYNVSSVDNANKRTIAAFQAGQTNAGPTGNFDATASTSTEWVSATVALRPDGCAGASGDCTQEVVNLEAPGGNTVALDNGDNVFIPQQPAGAGTITLSIKSCPDLALDVPLFGECVEITAPDNLAPLTNAAEVSLCSLEGSLDPPPTDVEQHALVTLYRKADNGSYSALPHTDPNCPSAVIGSRARENPTILTRLARVVTGAVKWLLEPQPLAAARVPRMRLDVGPAGRTFEFSQFQFGLPPYLEIEADNLFALPGGTVNPTVLVKDLNGDPVEGATVRFVVLTGGGSPATEVTALSDALGRATIPWILGAATGANTLKASGLGLAGEDPNNGPRTGVDPFIPLRNHPPEFNDATDGPAVAVVTGSVTFTATGAGISDDVETDAGWAMGGFWHRSTLKNGLVAIVNAAYPGFVTSATGDNSAGALPNPFGGSWVFWYGDEAAGNYLGTQAAGDAANSGGTSDAPNAGTLTSPAFLVPGDGKLRFNTWFEIESFDVPTFDLMTVSIEVVGGSTTSIGGLNGATDFDGAPNVPFTSGGFDAAPAWFEFFADLVPFAGQNVRLHFEFNTGDVNYNGFRGWLLDNIRVLSEPGCGICVASSSVLSGGGARPLSPVQPKKPRGQ